MSFVLPTGARRTTHAKSPIVDRNLRDGRVGWHGGEIVGTFFTSQSFPPVTAANAQGVL